jgi:ubiquinone biosynthesis protein COQ9
MTEAEKPMTTHGADLRAALLDAALPHVPFEGWSEHVILAAARELNVAPALALDDFPDGPMDLVAAFAERMDAAMLARLAEADIGALKIRARITLAVRTRLELLGPWREAERRAASLGALPHNAPRMLALGYRTVDAMWRAAGDRATDFNHYTKRGLLYLVYGATLAFWLQDDSTDQAPTWAFLDRRIADVMRIEGAKGTVGRLAARLPSPVALLARLRYGSGNPKQG